MQRMPAGSTCLLYGLLSEQAISDIDPLLMIGRKHRLEGFTVSAYMAELSIWGKLGIMSKC